MAFKDHKSLQDSKILFVEEVIIANNAEKLSLARVFSFSA